LSIKLPTSSHHPHILSLLLVIHPGKYFTVSGLIVAHTHSTPMKPQTMSSQIPRHINQHFGDLCLTSGSNTTGCSQGGILLPNGTQAARRPEAEEALSANSRVRDQVPARLASPSRPSARASRNTNTTSQKASAASDHPFEHSFGNRLYGPGRVPASEIVDGVRTVTGEPRPGDAKLLGRKLLNGTYISVSPSLVSVVDNRKTLIRPLSPLGRTGTARWALNKEIDA
jgi:hypothetical protein